ncbi:MAG: T9SS type A sorting domain-containing protein, partial [Bacteroidetes bacterium]|nr:T9SS type A sorting domain-containing protein [Bacteroidota bacterium]
TVQLEGFDNGTIVYSLETPGLIFVFNGDIGLFEGKLFVGVGPNQVSGQAYAPTAGVYEWQTAAPVTGTTPPYSGFDQGFELEYTDSFAPNPIPVHVTQRSYSDNDAPNDCYVILDFDVQNTSNSTEDFYIGLFADWDVGDFVQNLGGYDAATQLLYVWDDSGTSTNYFGVAAALANTAGVSGWELDLGAGLNPTETDHWNALTNGGGVIPGAVEDRRTLIGSGPYTLSPGESARVQFVMVGGTDEADAIACAASAQVVVPVELLSFDAILDGNDVSLRWATASETNNAGFEVQMDAGSGFQALGFVDGHGTTTEAQTYSYAVRDLDPGTYLFRLKQIDFDGAFEYHGDLEVAVETPDRYVLMQAYPNPFNPEATVRFAVRDSAPVTLTLHDALGRQVSTLYSGTPEANLTLSVRIDGSGLPSGLYLVRLTGSNFSASQTVTLLK